MNETKKFTEILSRELSLQKGEKILYAKIQQIMIGKDRKQREN